MNIPEPGVFLLRRKSKRTPSLDLDLNNTLRLASSGNIVTAEYLDNY